MEEILIEYSLIKKSSRHSSAAYIFINKRGVENFSGNVLIFYRSELAGGLPLQEGGEPESWAACNGGLQDTGYLALP